MRVAINCAIATRGVSGSARGLEHLIRVLPTLAGVELAEVWPVLRPRHSRVWNAGIQAHWDLRGAASRARSADILVSPCNVGRARHHQGHAVVLHDTMVLDHPHRFDAGYARYAQLLFGLSVRHADVVLVPSQFTRDCVLRRWPSLKAVVVAPWPVAVSGRTVNRTPARGRILMVGATEPHKRHILGIEAVRRARELSGEHFKLCIVGPAGRAEQDVLSTLRAADPAGLWTIRSDRLSNAGLDREYAQAHALLQPSEEEGYGLPVGEAAARGVPTVHSGRGSLSEIAPGAVTDPDDPTCYAARLTDLMDPEVHARAARDASAAAGTMTDERFASALGQAIT